MKGLHMVTFILLIIGGLNWLLIGLFNWGIGQVLPAPVAQVIYILVGLSAIVEIIIHKSICRKCSSSHVSNASSSM